MPYWTTHCQDCPNRDGVEYRAIGGTGPQPARVLIILERPGRDENRAGCVAVGKTGQELDGLYLRLASLDRSEVRVCNTVLCGALNNRTPSHKEATACASHHLVREIERTDPAAIILCGGTACSLVPGLQLDLHHGIPQHTSKAGTLLGWSGWLIPMFHPAIGLHESRWMTQCIEDWTAIRESISAGVFESDPVPDRPASYSLWKPNSWSERPPQPPPRNRPCLYRAIDTESHAGRPWSVQLSTSPGTGTLFLASDPGAMRYLRDVLNQKNLLGRTVPRNEYIPAIFHHAAHDLEELHKLGIEIQPRAYRDTMQEAYHLGNLPQGLKALSYRLFRHTMTSFAETVRPPSIRALLDWLMEAREIARADLSIVERVQLKTKVREKVSKSPLEKLIERLIRLSEPLGEYDPWERLREFWREERNDWQAAHIESRIGTYPRLGIENCKLDDAIRYAVGDADYTGRVAMELERRRLGLPFSIQPGDCDV